MTDSQGQPIKLHQFLTSSTATYITFIDPDFGLCIRDMKTGVVEKLYQEIASELTIYNGAYNEEESIVL